MGGAGGGWRGEEAEIEFHIVCDEAALTGADPTCRPMYLGHSFQTKPMNQSWEKLSRHTDAGIQGLCQALHSK